MARLQLLRHLRRLVHVGDAQADAGRRGEPLHLLRVLDVDERHAVIEFEMAGLEHADHA